MPLYNKINLWHLLYKIHIFTHAEHLQIPQCVVSVLFPNTVDRAGLFSLWRAT